MKTLVTGAAGFLGSHLVDALLARGDEVVALDNLSSGSLENLQRAHGKSEFTFHEADLKAWEHWNDHLAGVSTVYHFAADPEVRVGEGNPQIHFNENLLATFKLLEGIRKSRDAKRIIFASTSTVYGEASIMPTPENYGPLIPISTYGASKLGCEAMISAYAYTFGLRGLILRLGNIVGSRSQHGIIWDLVRKLKSNSRTLEILGDGTQEKSYLHVVDCIGATLLAADNFLQSRKRVDVLNVSSLDKVSVKRIAEIVVEESGAQGVRLRFTGGVDGGRGWLGDVKIMHLSVGELLKLGWKPKYGSAEAIRVATREILNATPLSGRKGL